MIAEQSASLLLQHCIPTTAHGIQAAVRAACAFQHTLQSPTVAIFAAIITHVRVLLCLQAVGKPPPLMTAAPAQQHQQHQQAGSEDMEEEVQDELPFMQDEDGS